MSFCGKRRAFPSILVVTLGAGEQPPKLALGRLPHHALVGSYEGCLLQDVARRTKSAIAKEGAGHGTGLRLDIT